MEGGCETALPSIAVCAMFGSRVQCQAHGTSMHVGTCSTSLPHTAHCTLSTAIKQVAWPFAHVTIVHWTAQARTRLFAVTFCLYQCCLAWVSIAFGMAPVRAAWRYGRVAAIGIVCCAMLEWRSRRSFLRLMRQQLAAKGEAHAGLQQLTDERCAPKQGVGFGYTIEEQHDPLSLQQAEGQQHKGQQQQQQQQQEGQQQEGQQGVGPASGSVDDSHPALQQQLSERLCSSGSVHAGLQRMVDGYGLPTTTWGRQLLQDVRSSLEAAATAVTAAGPVRTSTAAGACAPLLQDARSSLGAVSAVGVAESAATQSPALASTCEPPLLRDIRASLQFAADAAAAAPASPAMRSAALDGIAALLGAEFMQRLAASTSQAALPSERVHVAPYKGMCTVHAIGIKASVW